MCANFSSLGMTMVMRKITLATSLMTVMDMDMGKSMITDTTMTTIPTIPMLITSIHNEKESRIRMY